MVKRVKVKKVRMMFYFTCNNAIHSSSSTVYKHVTGGKKAVVARYYYSNLTVLTWHYEASPRPLNDTPPWAQAIL